MPKPVDLSGLWGGMYWYPDSVVEPVSFSAWLSVIDGVLTGTTLEPNTFLLNGPEELGAKLTGSASVTRVQFSKAYPDVEQPPVIYSGAPSEDGNKISGSWRFRDLGYYSGGFEMTRTTAKSERMIKIPETVG